MLSSVNVIAILHTPGPYGPSQEMTTVLNRGLRKIGKHQCIRIRIS
jgi:hypothetical protein